MPKFGRVSESKLRPVSRQLIFRLLRLGRFSKELLENPELYPSFMHADVFFVKENVENSILALAAVKGNNFEGSNRDVAALVFAAGTTEHNKADVVGGAEKFAWAAWKVSLVLCRAPTEKEVENCFWAQRGWVCGAQGEWQHVLVFEPGTARAKQPTRRADKKGCVEDSCDFLKSPAPEGAPAAEVVFHPEGPQRPRGSAVERHLLEKWLYSMLKLQVWSLVYALAAMEEGTDCDTCRGSFTFPSGAPRLWDEPRSHTTVSRIFCRIPEKAAPTTVHKQLEDFIKSTFLRKDKGARGSKRGEDNPALAWREKLVGEAITAQPERDIPEMLQKFRRAPDDRVLYEWGTAGDERRGKEEALRRERIAKTIAEARRLEEERKRKEAEEREKAEKRRLELEAVEKANLAKQKLGGKASDFDAASEDFSEVSSAAGIKWPDEEVDHPVEEEEEKPPHAPPARAAAKPRKWAYERFPFALTIQGGRPGPLWCLVRCRATSSKHLARKASVALAKSTNCTVADRKELDDVKESAAKEVEKSFKESKSLYSEVLRAQDAETQLKPPFGPRREVARWYLEQRESIPERLRELLRAEHRLEYALEAVFGPVLLLEPVESEMTPS